MMDGVVVMLPAIHVEKRAKAMDTTPPVLREDRLMLFMDCEEND